MTNVSLNNILLDELNNYKRILTTKSIASYNCKKNLNMNALINDQVVYNLIVGIISSKISLLNKFVELNKCDDYMNKYNQLLYETNNDLSDILIRFCGFHKILSVLDKTIVTIFFKIF